MWGWNEDETEPHNFLIDFGVSVTVESLGDSNWDFDAGGSQLYMSREIWDFRISSNPTVADSWSAGMMFVELVRHKKYPFTFKHMLTLKQLLDLGEEHLGIVGDPKEIAEFNKEKRKEVFDRSNQSLVIYSINFSRLILKRESQSLRLWIILTSNKLRHLLGIKRERRLCL